MKQAWRGVLLLLALSLALAPHAVFARQEAPPSQPLADARPLQFRDRVEEVRFRALTEQLRCVMCQNQSLADSNALIAQDLRREVLGLMREGSSDEQIKQFQERFIAGWAGYPVVGSPEQVVEEMGRLNEAGMDGMIMGFVDYNEEMKYFGEKVMPLMKEAGLRH